MRRFHLERDTDATGISGTGHVAEGCVFSNGYACMTWLTQVTSCTWYQSIADVAHIHTHGGLTRIVFDDPEERDS
jgi:hypothetical protein